MELPKKLGPYHSIWAIVGMMVLYIVSARVGMLLAVGDSSVTILWPPSGIALAAALLLGPRVLPGIWLGYVVGNGWWLLGNPETEGADLLPHATNAFVVTLQAQLGAMLLRRFALPFEEIRQLKDMLWYLILAGPISCLIAGLAGPTTLLMFEVIPAEAFVQVATTWWLGDTMGVLFLVPLILGFVGHGEDRFNTWLYVASSMLMLLGVLVLVGWYQAKPELARLHPAFDIMDHKTALAFVLSGFGVLTMNSGSRLLAQVMGVLIMILAAASLSQHIIDWSFPGDSTFANVQNVESIRPDRMAPNAGFCFLILGFGIVTLSGRRGRSFSMFASLSGATIMSFGLVAYLSILSDIPIAFTWGTLTRMGVHTALGIIIMGAIFVVLSARHLTTYAEQQIRISLPLGLFMLLMTLTFSQALLHDEARRIETRIEERLAEYDRMIHTELERRTRELQRMADRWAAAGGMDRVTWTRDAQFLLHDFGDFQAIEWASSDCVIRWVLPLEGNEQAVNLNLKSPHPSGPLLLDAKESGRFQTTSVIDLAQGGKGFVVYSPIGKGPANDGFIVGVFRLQPFFDQLLEPLANQFQITVYENGKTVYRSGDINVLAAKSFPSSTIYDMGLHNKWVTKIAPRQDYVEQERSILPMLIFVGGLLVSVLTPTCIYLFYGALHQMEDMNHTRAQLESSENRFRMLAENSYDVIWSVDLNFTHTYVSPAVKAFRGVTPEVAMTQDLEEFMTPESVDRVRNEFAKTLQRLIEEPDSRDRDLLIELEMFHADGHRVYGEIRPSLLRNTDGEVIGLQGITRDITERKEAGQRQDVLVRLALVPELYTQGLEPAAKLISGLSSEVLHCERTSIWLVSEDRTRLDCVSQYIQSEDRHEPGPSFELGRIQHFMDALEQQHVIAVNDVYESDAVSEFLLLRYRTLGITSVVLGAIRIGGQVRGVVSHEHAGPKREWRTGDIQFVAEIAGQVAHIVTYDQLMNERNRAHRFALKAGAANRSKMLFISNMSHEIRTPMNIIMGYSEHLSNTHDLSVEHRASAQQMYQAARRLMAQLNSLIELSRTNTGQLTVVKSDVNLRRVCAETMRLFKDSSAVKGLDLRWEIDDTLPGTVLSDEEKILQILTNFVGNAIKFTESGTVELRVQCQQAVAGRLPISISVSDTGIGMSPESVERVFQPFMQVDDRPGIGEGSGLGLSISQEYARLLGGQISVDSVEHEGTTFCFEFAVDAVENEQSARDDVESLDIPDLPASRILVVEPHDDVMQLLNDLMGRTTLHVSTATSGEEALEYCDGFQPDLVWLASRLTDISATTVIERIRENPELKNTRICLSVDASQFSDTKSDGRARGADMVIRAPFTASQVYSTLEQILSDESETSVSIERDLSKKREPDVWKQLDELPRDQLNTMCDALRAINLPRIRLELSKLSSAHQPLVSEIEHHLERFEYDKILERIDDVRNAMS